VIAPTPASAPSSQGASIDCANTNCLVHFRKFDIGERAASRCARGFGSEIGGADGGGAAEVADIAFLATG
jgi:hypothetical protein